MSSLSVDIVNLIEAQIPELKKKVQPGIVDAKTLPPYAAYSEPNEEAVRTKDGIVSVDTVFELAIFNSTKVATEALKNKIINKLDRKYAGDRRLLFSISEYGYQEDYKLHGYVLTFKIR